MKIKTLTSLSILSAAALILFVIEAQIPTLIPIPGIKLGISNVVTLFTAYAMSRKKAGFVLAVRVVLGSIFTGQALAFIYSACGAILSFAVLCALKSVLSKKQMWAVGGFCALAHNAAQLLAACVVMRTQAVFWYAPVLCISGVITGIFTGLAAQLTLQSLERSGVRFT